MKHLVLRPGAVLFQGTRITLVFTSPPTNLAAVRAWLRTPGHYLAVVRHGKWTWAVLNGEEVTWTATTLL
jgi:hypothetical protein